MAGNLYCGLSGRRTRRFPGWASRAEICRLCRGDDRGSFGSAVGQKTPCRSPKRLRIKRQPLTRAAIMHPEANRRGVSRDADRAEKTCPAKPPSSERLFTRYAANHRVWGGTASNPSSRRMAAGTPSPHASTLQFTCLTSLRCSAPAGHRHPPLDDGARCRTLPAMVPDPLRWNFESGPNPARSAVLTGGASGVDGSALSAIVGLGLVVVLLAGYQRWQNDPARSGRLPGGERA